MPREFNAADRIKKQSRVASGPADAVPAGLEDAIKAALDQGCLPCPAAWGLAGKFKVPKSVVGQTVDALGIRISNCQLGCFKVDKNLHADLSESSVNRKASEAVASYGAENKLTCSGAFNLAREIGLRPMDIADAANLRHIKIRECQLGCW
jgi:hypothetical protein